MTKWRMLGSVKVDGENVYTQEQALIDELACELVHQEQIQRYGADVVGDLPCLTKFPVWLALVAERNGEIVDFCYFEMNLEFCQGGCDPRASAALRRVAPGLIQRFVKKGFRLLRTFIPKGAPAGIGKELKRTGLRSQDEMYEHFLLDMRTKENIRG